MKGAIIINQRLLVMFLFNGFLAVFLTRRNLICKYESLFLVFRKDDRTEKTDISYYLGVAYASNLGGAGTLTGTGTNLTFKGIWDT
jgi:Na+/H+ antiporter NhaD/arsenite permease-like protein